MHKLNELKEKETCAGEERGEKAVDERMDWRCALGAEEREEEPAGSRRTKHRGSHTGVPGLLQNSVSWGTGELV